ncbi:MAG TPA: hypothetical protein VHB69_15260 [Mycobacteriales bacterium]|nr:hypothetical protein [Mycobacteriales bacterium]
MKKSTLALGATAGVAVLAMSAPIAQASGGLKVSVSPTKPSIGQTVKGKATGATPNHTYVCILTLTHPGTAESAAMANVNDTASVKSNSSGVVSCKLVFLNFSHTIAGKSHSCPPTKADKKSHWGCGFAVANLTNHKQFAVAPFKF